MAKYVDFARQCFRFSNCLIQGLKNIDFNSPNPTFVSFPLEFDDSIGNSNIGKVKQIKIRPTKICYFKDI